MFYPDRKRLPWLFEHRRRLSPGCWRAVKSWWMAIVPPRFWRRVTPACAPSFGVALWPLAALLTLGVGVGTVRFAYLLATGYASPFSQTYTRTPSGPVSLPVAFEQRVSDCAGEAYVTPWMLPPAEWPFYPHTAEHATETWALPAALAAGAVVTGLTLLTLSESRRICGVRGLHILRASAYRLAPLGVVYLCWCLASLAPDAWMWPLVSSHGWYIAISVLAAACIAWGSWWWWTAMRTGWMMQRAGLAAALMGAVDMLACSATLLWLSPRYLVFFV